MRLLDRILLGACRRSWKVYQHANFCVDLESIRLPVIGGMGLEHIAYQQAQFTLVLKSAIALRPDGHVVDIGANTGRFLLSLLALDRTQPYLGFEPLPSAAAYVRRIIVENHLMRHNILPIALGDRCGVQMIHFGYESDASATLSQDLRPPSMYQCEQLVSVCTGDLTLSDTPSIAVVKIDVEGSEIFVLRGMTAVFERHRPPLLLEVMPYAYLLDGTFDRGYFGNLSQPEARRVGEARRGHCLELNEFLGRRDYTLFACARDGSTTRALTLDRGDSRDRDTDFLAVPSEMADAFESEIARGRGVVEPSRTDRR